MRLPFRYFPYRPAAFLVFGLLLVGFDAALGADFIPGRFQNAIRIAKPAIFLLIAVSAFFGFVELTFARRQSTDLGTPVRKGKSFLKDDVDLMCKRLDAWLFGPSSAGANERMERFRDLVENAKVYPVKKRHHMAVFFDEGGKTVIFRSGSKRRYNLHELAHIYQEVCWGALTKEYQGRITIPLYIKAEIQVTWFAGQKSWTTCWVVIPLFAVISVISLTVYAMATALPPS